MKIYMFKMKNSLSLIALVLCCTSVNMINAQSKQNKNAAGGTDWLAYFDFDNTKFQVGMREYGPFTRWWLPGNDVTKDELQREIRMFSENGFAGVEVQPFTMGLDPKAPKDQLERVYSWDTPSFYDNMKAIMQQAQVSEIVVDMNAGSGWPMGGSFFDPSESMRTLAVADSLLTPGSLYNGKVPMIRQVESSVKNHSSTDNLVKPQWGVIKSVIVAKVLRTEDEQVFLDSKSVVDLTSKVKNNMLKWKVPSGQNLRLIVSWSIPTGEVPSLSASKGVQYVIDYLDPVIVNKTYDYLFGARTGLPAYFSKPMRAVFNDSYEFHVDRIISKDFIKIFKEQNGYDISPYLSSVVQKGYDNPTFLASAYHNAKPPFVLDEKNQWRIMYDYDQTVNRVFRNNFIKTSNEWMKKSGLLHRTQAYGFPIDLIGAASIVDIPEAEQLFAEGSEGYLKLVTSGAHLNNRPIISQESFVSILRAEMTTPQKIKVWADKSFACGINQIIYHGSPYKYNNGEYGKEGWNTWSNSFVPYLNFSSGMNESDPFWKDIKEVNKYLARCQYALRAGKPQTDVLIYMPFNNFSEDQIGLNPEETLFKGYFKGVEPDIKGFGTYQSKQVLIKNWYNELWKTINELESKGITWEFVNDEYLQKAKMIDGKINIQDNRYQVLILANLPYVNINTVKSISALSKTGMSIWAIGECPKKQPSYLDFESKDKQTAALMNDVWNEKNTVKIVSEFPVEKIDQVLHFAKEAHFSRQINRQMSDGSIIKFISNKTDQWQSIEINVGDEIKNCYWFSAEDGSVILAGTKNISYRLAPYGSIILFASTQKDVLKSTFSIPVDDQMKDVADIEKWNIQVGKNTFENSLLFDWVDNEKTKFSSDEGIYLSNFNVNNIKADKSYYVDLGKVNFVAEVKINGVNAGKRLFAPYRIDITPLIKEGTNTIEVIVTTTRRNAFTGEAVKGNPNYAQFKGKSRTLLSSGLQGPVRIKEN